MRAFLLRLVGCVVLFGVLALLTFAQAPDGGFPGGRGGPGGLGGGKKPGLGSNAGRVGRINQALPEGLRHVPTNGVAFVYVRVGDFLKADHGQALLKQLGQDANAAPVVTRIEQALGVKLADLESVTLLLTHPAAERPRAGLFRDPAELRLPTAVRASADTDGDLGALLLVAASRPFDRAAILKTLGQPAPGGFDPLARTLAETSAVFLGERCVALGTPAHLRRYVAQAGNRETWLTSAPLADALARGTTPHLIVAGGQVPAELQAGLLHSVPARQLAPLLPLLHAPVGLTLDVGENAELKVRFSPTESEHETLLTLEAVKSLKALAALALDADDVPGSPLPRKALRKAVGHAIVEQQQGNIIELSLRLPADPDTLGPALAALLTRTRLLGARPESANNLKQIGLALHAYNDTHNGFPPAGISGPATAGKAMLSWRVAILPYLEQAELYKQFDLNLPWDHPHNKKLIMRMPNVFAQPGVPMKEPGLTYYRALVGPGTVFERLPGRTGQVGVRINEITDGTSNTLMIVEASEPTIWTRPDDLPYDPEGPLPKLGAVPGGWQALFADGSVHFLPPDLPEVTLRALISRSGGEVVEVP